MLFSIELSILRVP